MTTNRFTAQQLIARLKESQDRIGKMCSELRPPKMSIPARPEYDDDLFITETLKQTIAMLEQAATQAGGEAVAWKVMVKGGKFNRGFFYDEETARDSMLDGDTLIPLCVCLGGCK